MHFFVLRKEKKEFNQIEKLYFFFLPNEEKINGIEKEKKTQEEEEVVEEVKNIRNSIELLNPSTEANLFVSRVYCKLKL